MTRLFLLFLPVVLYAQTLQFGADFGGSCISAVCEQGALFYPDTVTGMAVDSSGNTYVVGTSNGEFPLVNAIQASNGVLGPGDTSQPFVAKVNPAGTKFIYATPIAGPQPFPSGFSPNANPLLPIAIAIDAAGNAYITGTSAPAGFPLLTGTTPFPYSYPNPASNDAFIIKLDPSGKLLLSTMFGGSNADAGSSIALDSAGRIYIAGTTRSSDFPVTTGSAGAGGIFVAKMDPASGKLIYAAVLGGGQNPRLAMGPSGDVLIAATPRRLPGPRPMGWFSRRARDRPARM